MNHDLVERFRERLDNITISDYHGLQSPGLTCYLNSVLQVLFMTEDFREAVKQCRDNNSSTIDPHLGRLFSELQTRVARTHNVTEQLGITNVFEQRDAAEYFEKILCRTSPEAATMFKGELNHKATCLGCEERNDSRSPFWILPLAVEDSRRQTYSVERGLAALFNGENVCGDNKMYCNRCRRKQDADFGCEITRHPDILTLLLKRFSLDYRRRRYVKLYCKVDIPQTLHLQDCTYDLYALVNHFGDLTGGHYTAQIKSFETEAWYHFNDDVVERVRKPIFGAGDEALMSCTAYLLMYRKVTGEASARLNGDPLQRGGDDTLREKLPQPHTEADGDGQTKNSAKLQKDGRQKRHERDAQPDTNSKEHKQHLESRGTPAVQLRTHSADDTLKPNHEPQKKIRKPNKTARETQASAVAKTGTKTTRLTGASPRGTGVKPAETKVGKNKKEAAESGVRAEGRTTHKREGGGSESGDRSEVKTCRVSSPSRRGSDEPTKCHYSPDRYRKSHSSEERKQGPAASPSKRGHDARDRWRC